MGNTHNSKATNGLISPSRALIASVTGYAMDGFDLLILTFMLAAIKNDLGLSDAQGSSIMTWTLLGSVAGGVIFGQLSDRFGRIRMLTASILVFSIFTGLCAIAQGYWDLLTYRTLAGVGLGGEFGIGMALVAEVWPADKRTRASSYVGMGWQAGVLAATMITPLLLPLIGWRGMFLVGLLPALASFAIRHASSEPDNVVNVKPETVSFRSRFAELFKDRQTACASIGVLILTSVQNFGYYGLMVWMPSYLSKQFGMSLQKSGLWTAATVIGMTFGIWLFGQLSDRFGRWKVFLLYQAGAAIMVVVYAAQHNIVAVLITGAIMGIFVNGMIGGYGALISDLYPVQARATAQNVLFNIGRGVGGLGPMVVGAVVAQYSFSIAITLLMTIYVLDILATLFLLPKLNGGEAFYDKKHP